MRTLEGGEPNARVGACWALGRLRGGAAPAVPLLAKLLSDKDVWLRVNADKADNDQDDHSLIEKGERYYWKNGEGVVFDDTFLHDAANDSDEVRVVLWLDIKRKMPWYLDLYNRACLWIVHRDESVRIIRENAAIS